MAKELVVGTPEWKSGMVELADRLARTLDEARNLAHALRHHGPDGVDPRGRGEFSSGLPCPNDVMHPFAGYLGAEASAMAEELCKKLEALRPFVLAAAVHELAKK